MNVTSHSASSKYLNQRAKYQLIGTVVLVVLAIILFSWVFGADPPVRSKQAVVEIPLDEAQQSTVLATNIALEKLPQAIDFATKNPNLANAAKADETQAATSQASTQPINAKNTSTIPQSIADQKNQHKLTEPQKLAHNLLKDNKIQQQNSVHPKSNESALWISVGVYANKNSVKNMIGKLEKQGFKVKQQAVEKAGKPAMTRVMIGPFGDALEIQAKLIAVRKIEPNAQILNN